MNLSSIKSLHIIRGLAALIVVIYHAKFVLWSGGQLYVRTKGLHSPFDYFLFSIDMLSSCGKQCVIIFFILSAFVIKYSFTVNQYSYKTFYRVRLIRIYLPFLFSLLIAGIVFFVSVNYINPSIINEGIREYNTRLSVAAHNFTLQNAAKTLFFIKDEEYFGFNFAYWSLLHEAIFYILFPFYLLLKTFYRAILFVVLLPAHFVINKSDIFYYQLFFLSGMFLYDYYSTRIRKPLLKSKKLYFVLLLLMYPVLNLAVTLKYEYLADIFTVVYSFAIFDFILLHKIKPMNLLFKLGNISYTLYLNHLSVLLLFYALLTMSSEQLIFFDRYYYYVGTILAVLMSILLYKLVERPTLLLLEKQKQRRLSG